MDDDERELAIDARAGRREAFDALVDRCGPGLLAFLHRLTDRREDAQDLYQETFLRAWQSLGALRDPRAFRGWLARIAVNAVRRHAEQRQSRAVERPLAEPAADIEVPAGRLETRERETEVRRAIAALPSRQRAVLSLRLDLNLPFQEIGRTLGIREENARAHHYQALRTLRRALRHLAATAPAPGEEP